MRGSGRNPLRLITSATWLYPFKGIFFFTTHRSFWHLLTSRLLPIILLSLFIYILLFVFAYLPQVAFLALFHRPAGAAWLNATFLVLGEGLVAVSLLFEAFFVDEQCVDVFDGVLLSQGYRDLAAQGRLLHPAEDEWVRGDPIKMMGKPTGSAIYSPFSLRQILEFVILLPLNLIPYIGVPLFLLLTGYRAGPFHHHRYFQLRGFTKKEKKEFVRQRRIKYTIFGTIGLMLQLVPGLSMVFLLTTSAGSALWVGQIERARRAREGYDEGGNGADGLGDRQDYHDDPV